MLVGAIYGMMVGTVIVVAGYIYVGLRKPPATIRNKPVKVQAIVSTLPKDEVLKRIRSITTNQYYKIEEGFNSDDFILFSEKPNAMSWGFYFQVFISEQNGHVVIEVSTRSKIYQTGPIVTKATNNFLDSINQVLRPY